MTSRIRELGGINQPFYYRKEQEGLNDPKSDNPYRMSLSTHEHHTWTATRRVYPADGSICGTNVYDVSVNNYTGLGGSVHFSYPGDPEVDNELLDRLVSKVNGHNWQAGVTAGEARETVAMIGNTAKTLATAIVALKSGNVSLAASTLGLTKTQARDQISNVAQGYLYMKFGIMPLMKDAYDAGEALWVATKEPQKARYRARRTVYGEVTGFVDGELQQIGDTKVGRNVILHLQEGPHDWVHSLGLTDPGTLYDLIPLSFVADWFFPLGDYLHRRYQGLRFDDAKTVITTYRYGHYSISAPVSPSLCWTVHNGSSTETYVEVERIVSTGIDRLIHTPTLRTPKSWGQAASACALLWQRFGSRKGAVIRKSKNYFGQPVKPRDSR